LKLLPDELARTGEDEAAQAKREARRAACRDAKARAQAELEAALATPLVPGGKPRSLEAIAAQRPKHAAEHDAVPQLKP
jgi:hypothetical protein